ncbi:ABC transporter [Plectosphaerella cucumerina]|uniref:ABC transporter n=1 Tax=Plectosphaerella cucumerina TaxID=40658 RepID=A0A8K0WZI9_9PEZI|nr:ABC transporter [Plectosphaerella cucumerina]
MSPSSIFELRCFVIIAATDPPAPEHVATVSPPKSPLATITPQSYLLIAQAAVAGLVFLSAIVQPWLPRPPLWLRPFVREEDSWSHPVTRTLWTFYLGILSVLGLVVSAGMVLTHPLEPTDGLYAAPWLAAVFITVTRQPITTPKRLLLLFVMIIASNTAFLALSKLHHDRFGLNNLFNIIIGFALVLGILAMPMRDPGLSRDGIAKSMATSMLSSPEDNLTLWQFMTVSWIRPLMRQGSSGRLDDEHVWQLPYEFQHSRLHLQFRDLQGSIFRRLVQANGLDLFIISGLGILETAAELSGPLLLKALLESIKEGHAHLATSVGYAAVMLILRLVSCQSAVFSLWFSRRCYERSRGEMITTIYAKTLTRKTFGETTQPTASDLTEEELESRPIEITEDPTWKNKILRLLGLRRDPTPEPVSKDDEPVEEDPNGKPASTGKILNLMRNDAYELVTQPLRFILSFALILSLLGWPSLMGLAAVVAAQGINTLVIKRALESERRRRAASDERIHATTQFVEGIRHLRWYDWQDKWVGRVTRTRQHELKVLLRADLWQILMNVINVASGVLFPVFAFFAYTFIAGRQLSVEVAFPALSVFAMLESSFRELPNLVKVLLNANIAMGRIERFIAEPDKEDFYNAAFAWPGRSKPVLRDLNLVFPSGLTVVFGKAILGELDCQSGTFFLPWLQHMSIRDNILFSSPYDPQRYHRVLDACALLPDLANLKDGDLSDIGENGIGLSGGQKARVALARAVYSQSRILLLDDPLAALDHHTAEFIGRTVILVTHRIVEVEDNRARALSDDEAAREVAKFMREEELIVAAADDEELSPTTTEDTESSDEPNKFIEEEHRASGGVMFSVYWTYIRAGTLTLWAILVLHIGLLRLATLINFWFLKSWGEAYKTTAAIVQRSPLSDFDLFGGLPDPAVELKPWLLVYLGIALGQVVVHIFFQCFVLAVILISAKSLFSRVVDRVSRATFRFYDVTPVGRLMNRLVSDIGMIDGGIITPLQLVAWWSIAWLSSMFVIASAAPVFLAFSIVVSGWFVLIFRRFLPTSQSLRRLEMVSLSPLMSNFGILIDGLTTIRAFRAQTHFQNRNIEVTDNFQKMDHFYWGLQSWVTYRFDVLSAVSTFALTLLALYNDLSPGLTAFVLTTASQFVLATHNLCKQYGTLQMDFVSVERVIELLDLPKEPQGKVQPMALWPSGRDDIIFDNVTLRYDKHLDPSLSEATFTIPGGSTCAVLGRTGSGKSTLALALLATMHPSEGSIRIGSVSLAEVDVHLWRQRISFVAQDPVLFPGTLRENLDPLEQFSDTECITVLHRILGPEWNLDSTIAGGGKNLSQGQRQLVGIGRAVLRRSAVVILDEATASIDKETAARVQDVLREELSASTVITIAHRLEAVKDADFFVRLDAGRVVDHGPATQS